eukprot:CAMPEP_0185597776 /NCGR_PEP_ID=MMETSP0434-20130131/81580_1 /TAXON_ID=626734 ORGANISM="Favella taraikaensis, Strain Fe Narragansett Bay" /NCGR_SAMPLE_ID=MMETSP0434 /ASSEMBLY_ACC=CAM_ASM_000379 /LENGTH=105 /DNA_ID=CAMNT_0028226589 /DNA_START=1109 /DNA_END=1426 /DNA_ORIENTATION=-
MLYMAMFIEDMQWLQLQVFIMLNFISLTYQIAVRPYEKSGLNFLNIFNELIGLLASYFLLPLQDYEYDPDQHYEMGFFVVYIFYFSGITNVAIIIGLGLIDFFKD